MNPSEPLGTSPTLSETLHHQPYRINTIAFPGGEHDANKYISRQHAHIEWSDEGGCFLLYADEGGVPPESEVAPTPLVRGQIRAPIEVG